MKIKPVIKIILVAGGLVLAAILLISLTISISGLKKELSSRNEAMFSALHEQNETLDLLQNNAVSVSNDVNTLRLSLMLPEKDYPVLQSEGESETVENLPYFLAIDALFLRQNRQLAGQQFADYIQSADFLNAVAITGVELKARNSFSEELYYNEQLIGTVHIAVDSQNIYFKTKDNEQNPLVDNNLEEYIRQQIKIIQQQSADLQKYQNFFNALTNNSSISTALDNNQALLIFSESNPGALELLNKYEIRQEVFFLNSDPLQFSTTAGYSTDDLSDIEKYLLAQINAINNQSENELELDQSRLLMEQVAADESFQLLLKSKELILVTTPRIDEELNDYIHFDLLDQNNQKAGSFGILRNNREMYILDQYGLPISSLKGLDDYLYQDNEKKKLEIPDILPNVSELFNSKDSVSILLVGSHENEADSIQLVHANKKTDEIYMLSIPRDIYYQGYKINNIYRTFGAEKFTEEISNITGLEIDYFIEVDMYAFIQAVDVLGGIDVTLESPVIDPTFKVLNDGVWSTLHYDAGDYHMSGLEALRLARSRHYSSDFERSARQQMILMALKDSFFTNANISTINKMVSILMKYVNTNLSVMEIVNLVLAFKNADIAGQDVLSTSNILYHTYSEMYKAALAGRDFVEGSRKGLWILLPKDDDWNVIKWYIRDIIGEVHYE